MQHGSGHGWIVLDTVDSQSCPLGESSVFFLGRLDLDRVEGDECRLPGSLIAHVLDTVYGDLFVLYHDTLRIAAKHRGDGSVVFVGCRLTQVQYPAVNA